VHTNSDVSLLGMTGNADLLTAEQSSRIGTRVEGGSS
jgi:hypothetical protein